MPSIVKGHVIQARDLPVMDRNIQGDLYTDAYVDIRFGGQESRTQVKHKTLAPEWNEPFRFEVNDNSTLQSEPIEFRVMDHDVYTSDDSVGIVHVDLSPLLMRIDNEGGNEHAASNDQPERGDKAKSIRGWFPIFDTLKGVRGELCVEIKLQFIGDEHASTALGKPRDLTVSAKGVQFFPMSSLEPRVYTVLQVLGFVEELLVDNDPEFDLMDRARSARSSNEMRLSLLYRQGAKVRMMLGAKVDNMVSPPASQPVSPTSERH